MKTLLLSIFALGLTMPLGCDQDTSDLDERAQEALTLDNVVLTPAEELESSEPIARVRIDEDPDQSVDEPFGLVAANDPTEALCWVTLDWCVHPVHGKVHCTYTAGCTEDQADFYCIVLANNNCF
ncbi:MAG: hypothetical protein K0V04_10755 [Deltaproteobacteria bacterium]|nr:hypothetical protein [Deltaproteobacteria bacterium]